MYRSSSSSLLTTGAFDTDSNPNTNTYSNAYSKTNCYSNANTDSYSNTNHNSNRYTNPNTDRYPHSDTNTHTAT